MSEGTNRKFLVILKDKGNHNAKYGLGVGKKKLKLTIMYMAISALVTLILMLKRINYSRIDIHFSKKKVTRAVSVLASTDATYLVEILGIQQPDALIMIAGGAGKMHEDVSKALKTFMKVIAEVSSQNGMIIDGGTDFGVMKLIGEQVAQQEQPPVLIGVSPEQCITYPGKSNNGDKTPLNPNHSHFVLVRDADNWGGETKTMYKLAEVISQHCPSVAVLINGGKITEYEFLQNVEQVRHILIIQGSGRLADTIANRVAGDPLPDPNPELDQAILKAINNGTLHILPKGSPPESLKLLLEKFLGKPQAALDLMLALKEDEHL